MAESCIFCALKELFAQFQYSKESALPPDVLRRALAETFFDQRRFQLGFMDDAAECFENILLRIHFHIASQEAEDMCSVSHCIPHQKFAMTLVEQTVCHVCGASSEPLPFTQMVHYVSASALCSQASLIQSKEQKMVSFGELLWRAGGMGDIRDCPSSCGAKIQIRRTLMNRPDIVSLGLVWDSERPTVEHIMDVLDTIGMTINMQEMFHSVVDSRWAATVTHHLVGMVTYYGKHYSTFFYHTKLGVWIYFDDATVREIGPHWKQVVDKCRRGHFQPLLLLYANPNGTPVPTANAPNTIINCMSDHKKRQLELQKMLVERHKYSQQHPLHTPLDLLPCPAANGINDRTYWQCSNWPQGNGTHYSSTKGNTRSNTIMHSSVPSSHQLKQRMRTYSDTSIVSESPNDCFAKQDDCTSDSVLDSELNSTYISRQTVESVLNLQRLQRQRSLNGTSVGAVVPGSRNSNSSLESFENSLQMREKASDGAEGVPRRRDSGNWSGDRNSASSASSTSLDGSYYYLAGAKRLCGGTARVANNFSKHEYMNVGILVDQGYDSYSLSSTDSYPSVGLPGSPSKQDPRLKQIPEATQPSCKSQTKHNTVALEQDDSVFEEAFTGGQCTDGSEDCDKLSMQADGFLKKSYEKEQAGDLKMAAYYCECAAAKARAAMDAPYSNAQSLIAAKMKHSTCVMRASNINKRIKEAEVSDRRWHKEAGHEGHHSRQGSRDSTHTPTTQSTQDNRDGKQMPAECPLEKATKNIEIYATLPKKNSKKKTNVLASQMSVRIKEDVEIYKDFLTKQRQNSKGEVGVKTATDLDSFTTKKKSKENHHSHRKNLSTMFTKDPELSDYCSEWEQTKKPVLHRTLSNPAGMKNHDSDGNSTATSTASMKKQHKIRRKLMGGFMRRKNRSLPDLRENQDALQDGSRSLDDTAIFDSGKNSHAHKTHHDGKDDGKDEQSATIQCRGFHQPHRAFVARGLCQRPLLTKVDPPQVEVTRSPSPIKRHPHRSASPTRRNDRTLVACMDTSCADVPYTTTSHCILSHDFCEGDCRELENYEMPSEENLPPPASPLLAPTPDIGSDAELHTAETNCFLMELQAKRKQIMDARLSGTLSECETNLTRNDVGQEEMPRKDAAFHPADGNWLQELQSKQMSMLIKKNEKLSDGPEQHEKEHALPVPPDTNKQANPQLTMQPRHEEDAPHSGQTCSKSLRGAPSNAPRALPLPANRSDRNQDDVKPRSVRDLASRFEKILKPSVSEPSQDSTTKPTKDLASPHQPTCAPVQVNGTDQKDVSAPSNTPQHYSVKCYTSTSYQAPTPLPQHTIPASTTHHLRGQQHVLNTSQQNGSAFPPHSTVSVPTVSCNQYQQQQTYSHHYANHMVLQQQFNAGAATSCHKPLRSVSPNVQYHVSSMQQTANVNSSSSAQVPHQPPAVPAMAPPVVPYSGAVYDQQAHRNTPLPSQYGKAFQCVKSPDSTDARPFVAVRMPQQTSQPSLTVQGMAHFQQQQQQQQGGNDISLRPVSPATSESSKRPTRPPDYETALQRLEMIKVKQRTASPDFTQSKLGDSLYVPQQGADVKKRKAAPKKSVTFSDEVVLVACAEEEESVYIPNPLLERVYRQHAAKQDTKDTSGQPEGSLPSPGSVDVCDGSYQAETERQKEPETNSHVPCHLCHKKFVSPPTVYCHDCSFYMSRFQKRT